MTKILKSENIKYILIEDIIKLKTHTPICVRALVCSYKRAGDSLCT